MDLRTIDDLELGGARVVLRGDLNVPLKDGEITDDFRIRQVVPTIREILDRGASRIVVCSHLGRPKQPDPALSLSPVAARLGEQLEIELPLVPTPEDPPDATVAMLENVRFFPGETKDDPALAKRYASLGDVFVNDAFGSCHRAHASVAGLAEVLPSAGGRLLQREVRVLGGLLASPAEPFVAVLGGAKISDKLAVVENLLRVAGTIVIGGAMAFTFARAQGLKTGRSLVEEDMIDTCARLLAENGGRLLLPSDVVCASAMEAGAGAHEVAIDAIPDGEGGYDIGTETRRRYVDAVRAAATVMWNGPMGVFEIDDFAAGTRAVAAAVAKGNAYSVVGGGDSIAALNRFGYASGVDHASTGGGAMLEFLEGKLLPGLAPLRRS